MRRNPTALGWIDPGSAAADWHRAQVQRLARTLGYELVWADVAAVIPLVDQARVADVDVMIVPAPDHLDALTLNSLLSVVGVESACPRLSFARWAEVGPVSPE